MIQGHIDSVTRTQIVGWMHSDAISLIGVPLVAFIDDERVGGGDLGIYREDLLRAGIGDGRGGFSFPIELTPAQDVHAVEIRIQGGNVCLRQADTAIVARDEGPRRTPRPPPAPDCLAWMLGRGWLAPDHYAILERLARFGIHRQPLSFTSERLSRAWREEMSGMTRELLQVQMNRDVELDWREDLWEEHLSELRGYMHAEFPGVAPVVGLWAPWTNCLNVSEGSHLETLHHPVSSGVDYEFGDGTLLWINLDTDFHAPTGGLTSPTIAFVPVPKRPPGESDAVLLL